VLPALEVGGAEVLVARLAAALRTQMVEASVVGVLGGGPLEARLAALGVPFAVAPDRPHLPLYPTGLVEALRGLPADLLHAHSGTLQSAAVAATVLGLPLVYSEHGYYPDEPAWGRLVDRLSARRAAALVAVSAPLQAELARRLRPAAPPELIVNGVEIPPAMDADGRRAARARLGVPADASLIGTVGRLVAVKDHASLLRAFAAVRATHATARLVLVGDGPERAALERLASELGVGDAVTLAGALPDAAALVGAIDVYVSSSVTEGMPIAVLEAMAAGCAVVATDVGACAALLGEGACGVVVPPSRPDALAAAVGALLADAPRRAALGAAARARVADAYGLDACARRHADLYRRVLARAGH
jgi:glycosyltransferase involved in cell wall biosynthesis